jgi:hypothetical protein
VSDTIVPHARFLEIRQRRVLEELARHEIATPSGDSLDAQPVTIDDAAPGDDEHCGTRTAVPTSDEKDCVDRDDEQVLTDVRSFDQTSRAIAMLGDRQSEAVESESVMTIPSTTDHLL